MANSDKDILITPNSGSSSADPKIEYVGADSSGNDTITVETLYDGTKATLSFEGSAGQLFSIVNDLTSDPIFSVNDVSGIPSIEVDSDGEIRLAEFSGNVGIGISSPTELLHVDGTIKANNLTLASLSAQNSEATAVMIDGSGVIGTRELGSNAFNSTAFLTGNQTITLSGDVSGSGTTSIAVTIADDSHNHVISNVDGLQTALDAKLASSSYTAADVLTKIKTVDGSGSGLDADLLDGQQGSYYLDYNNFTNTPTIPSLSGYATESYVGTQISNLVDSAPGTLDTLNELAAALGDDANFSTTVTNSIATKLPLAGGTLTGSLRAQADLNYFGLASGNNEGEIIINTGQDGSPQIGFTEHGDASWAIGIDDADNSFKMHGTDSNTIPTINNLAIPLFEITTTAGTAYLNNSRIFTDAYHPNADTLTTARTISLTGAVTGSVSFNGSSNVSIATTATADPTLTLSGDASGSATFTNLGNATLSVTIADDSHNHVISNVDGLQTALDAKLASSSYTASDVLTKIKTVDGAGSGLDADLLDGEHGSYYATASALTSTTTTANAALPKSGGTMSGNIAMANYSITGLNQLEINDPGEGIVFKSGSSGDMTLKIIDDSSDNILQYSGTGAIFDVQGNITVTGTVDGRDIASDGSKLDGIESGATADQTAAEILTAIKTVDGAGSGLDADLLDGISSASFLRSDAADTFTTLSGTTINLGSQVSLAESSHRADLLAITSSTDTWGGITIANSSGETLTSFMGEGNSFGIYDDINNEWALLCTENSEVRLYHNGSEKLATTSGGIDIVGNITLSGTVDGRDIATDGTKLDGIAANANNYVFPYTVSVSASNNTVVQRHSSGYIYANYFNGTGTFSTTGGTSGMGLFTGTNGTDTFGRSYTAAAARALLNVENGATADQTAAEILTAIKTVDGAGSGLDADLLDGISSASFLRSDATDTFTTLTGTTLTVNGVLSVTEAIDLADNDILRFGSGDDVEFFCNGTHMYTDLNSGIGNWYIRDGTTTRFTFDDAGDFTATGNVTAYSDERLKDNILVIEGALEKVSQLRGVTFNRTDTEEPRRQTGVIAQEVEKVLPEAVITADDEMQTKSVAYGNMVGLLIEAIKELKTEVNDLKRQLKEIK